MASLVFLSAVMCFSILSVTGEGLKTCEDVDFPFGLNPHPYDCKKYLKCEDGQLLERTCPGPSVFNARMHNCDNPFDVPECKSGSSSKPPLIRTLPPLPVKTTTKPVIGDENSLCEDLKLPTGLYPNPLRCSRYIQCVNQMTYIFNCPPTLQFNVKTNVCDFPRHVKCINNYNFRGHVKF